MWVLHSWTVLQWEMGISQRTELWKMTFPQLEATLKSEGLDQKNIMFVVKMTDTVRITANSKCGFTGKKES